MVYREWCGIYLRVRIWCAECIMNNFDRRVATCKPPGLPVCLKSLQFFLSNFFHLGKWRYRRDKMVPHPHHVAYIGIDGRAGVVRNSNPGLYHVNPGLPGKTGWLRACLRLLCDQQVRLAASKTRTESTSLTLLQSGAPNRGHPS